MYKQVYQIKSNCAFLIKGPAPSSFYSINRYHNLLAEVCPSIAHRIILIDQSQYNLNMNYFGNEPTQYNSNYNNSPFSQTLIQNDTQQPSKASDLYGAARTLFIQRVYTILACQILVTVIMTAFSMGSFAFFKFQMEHIGLFYMAMIIAIVCQVWIFCCQGSRKYPQNIILVGLFTLCESYIVSFFASVTGMQSGNSVVLMAALMTLAVVSACTAYAIYTKQDYTTSSAIIIVITVVMLCLFVVLLFTNSPFIQALYCGLGVLLFGIYIVVDTQLIVGGKSAQLQIDDYFLGAMLLYVDIISIFIYILQLLGLAGSSSSQ